MNLSEETRRRQILLSDIAMDTFLGLAGIHREELFLPVLSAQGTEVFLKGRGELCEAGLMELDFDGKVYQDRGFARMTYSLAHPVAAASVEMAEREHIFVKGPLEVLMLVHGEGQWKLEMQDGTQVLQWFRDTLFPAAEGTLAVRKGEKALTASFSPEDAGSDERADVLARALCLLSGEGEKDA